jgi:glutathione S-transferase
MITVHGAPVSPFVRKVRLALEEKRLPYQLSPAVPVPKTEELLQVSPLGKIPVLEDDGFVTPDSSVICAYLERSRPEPRLYPTDPRELALALWYEEYGDTKLAEVTGKVLFQRFVRPHVLGEACDETIVRTALEEEIPTALAYLERQPLDGDGIVCGRFSIADIALFSPLASLPLAGEAIDAKRFPRVAGYFARLAERSAFRRILGEENRGAAVAA